MAMKLRVLQIQENARFKGSLTQALKFPLLQLLHLLHHWNFLNLALTLEVPLENLLFLGSPIEKLSVAFAPVTTEGDYSHQALAIYYDTNLVAWQSQRQSLVALSSAEAELIASVWGNRLALSLYGQLMEMILDKPTYITYCDNAAVVQLTQQLSASKTRTRHLSMRASWLHHLVQREHVSMQFVPTSYQKADILTKGLQAYTHELAREGLRLRLCNGL